MPFENILYYLCFKQYVNQAAAFIVKPLFEPNSEVVHFSTGQVGRDWSYFSSYYFLEGFFSFQINIGTSWTWDSPSIKNHRVSNLARVSVGTQYRHAKKCQVHEAYSSPMPVIDLMFTVAPSCWGCNDIGMHFRISMEDFFTLWSNNGKATVSYLVDGRGDCWTKPLLRWHFLDQ